MRMAEENSMIRVGIVSDVNPDKLRARVYFPDLNNMVSDWLYVLQRSKAPSNVTVEAAEGHTHEASGADQGKWIPEVNDMVVVVYTYGFNTDGYIVGVIP